MTGAETTRAIAAGCYLVPTLAWASMAMVAWRNVVRRQPGVALFRLWLPMLLLTAVYVGLGLVLALGGSMDLPPRPAWLTVGRDVCLLGAIALSAHVLLLSLRGLAAPPRAVVGWHYAAIAALGLVMLVVLPAVLPPERAWRWSRIVLALAICAASVFNAWRVARAARRHGWAPGGGPDVRTADAMIGLVGNLGLVAVFLWAAVRPLHASIASAAAESAVWLVLAVPYAVRGVSEFGRRFLFALVCVAISVGTYAGAGAVTPPASLARAAVTLAGFGLVLAVQPLLRVAIDRVVFRRGGRMRADLQELLQRVSPELGVMECCRRILAEAVPILGLRGGAILLRDGGTVVAGDFDAAALERLWPRGEAADRLPRRAFGGPDFIHLSPALQEALTEAHVVGILPLVSPRRRWGDFAASAGFRTAIYGEEDVLSWEVFAARFALLLEAADLIARAVAVERSFAHAQKLAALGEVAARIVHEIRNPVTAARSLAQQLAREAVGGETAHVILDELGRVERQVAGLLRFARREEYRFEAVELTALVESTLAALRPRLEGAGVAVHLDLHAGVHARADREKLRQVLVNLIENAVDAFAGFAGDRRLVVTVGAANGSATLSVGDTGPGVPPDALAHLFEPFFSLKESGTGLGLAIVRRTIEAHGGRVEAQAPPGCGLTVAIALPAVEEEGA